MNSLVLKIYTPEQAYELQECDYITLDIADGEKGEFSGSYGIKKGHADAVFAVAEGKITAKKDGEVVFVAKSSTGFATVKNNTVNVTVDKADIIH